MDAGCKHTEKLYGTFQPSISLVFAQTSGAKSVLEAPFSVQLRSKDFFFFFSMDCVMELLCYQINLLYMLSQLAFIVRMTFKENERCCRIMKLIYMMHHLAEDPRKALLVWYLVSHLSICLFICSFIHSVYFYFEIVISVKSEK